ncbi:hypothetical protein AAG906_019643 [Vitis piasezkii]
MCLTSGRSEANYIEDITHVILMRFSQKLLHVDKKLIGMDYHLQKMEEIFPHMINPLSNDVCMVGIYGFGGIEPNQKIQHMHKRSYDELDRTQKQIFLDVACFFNGEDKDFVTRILDACNFFAESGICVLSDKCLISIIDNNIWMHDLLRHLGRDIVRQEFLEDLAKWSRLCYLDVISRVLTRKMVREKCK